MIDVWGADHGGYVKRMKAAVAAVTGGAAELDIKLCQLVRLLRAGEPVKMSKRSGDFVTLREVVDEVGRDAVRFMMLFRKNDATARFRPRQGARAVAGKSGLLRAIRPCPLRLGVPAGAEAFPEADFNPKRLAEADLSRLSDDAEADVLRLVAQYPRVVEAAAEAHEPHRIAFFLYDLAAAFHGLWNKGKDLPQLRFVNQNDQQSTEARLALVHVVRCVLVSGLAVLGVTAPDEMR